MKLHEYEVLAERGEEETFVELFCEYIPNCPQAVTVKSSTSRVTCLNSAQHEGTFLGTWLPHGEGRLEKLRSIKTTSPQTQRLVKEARRFE